MLRKWPCRWRDGENSPAGEAGRVVKQGVVVKQVMLAKPIVVVKQGAMFDGKPHLPGLRGILGLQPMAMSDVVLKKDPLSCVVGARGITRASPFVASPENFVGR